MLDFHKILNVTNPLFTNLYNLYTLAFPPAERRNWAGLEYELTYEKRFSAVAVLREEKFVGMLNYWTFDRFSYIEHFAILPPLRNQKIGTEAMEMFKQQTKLPIILEVELPSNTNAIRRIRFYEKLGFSVISHKYAQPPYEDDGFLLPMLIMSNDPHFANSHFELIKEKLYTTVYHYDVEKDEFSING